MFRILKRSQLGGSVYTLTAAEMLYFFCINPYLIRQPLSETALNMCQEVKEEPQNSFCQVLRCFNATDDRVIFCALSTIVRQPHLSICVRPLFSVSKRPH